MGKIIGPIRKEIEQFLSKSPAFEKASGRMSQKGKIQFEYKFYQYWQWLMTEGKKKFEWAGKIQTPDDLIKEYDRLQGKERYLHLDAIEAFLRNGRSERLASSTKRSLLVCLKAFYAKNDSELPKRKIEFEVSDIDKERAVERRAIKTTELKSVIMRGNLLERSVLLCCLQGGLGLEEFELFNTKGYTAEFAEALAKGEIPLRVNLMRIKTRATEGYFTFFHKDAVASLKLWLTEREALTGKPIKISDPIFVSLDKHSRRISTVRGWTLQRIMRTLSQEVGLEPQQKFDATKQTHQSQIRHRFHMHELRDVFRTECRGAGVADFAAEFFMGHETDPLKYDKSPETNPQLYRDEYDKIGSRLNLLSSEGLEQVKEQGDRVKVLEDLSKEQSETIKELERSIGIYNGSQANELIEPKGLLTNGTFEIRTAKDEQELDALLGEGFEVVLTLPDGRWKLRRKKS
jgi:hypothetical protein